MREVRRVVAEIVLALERGGSAQIAGSSQRFFKHAVVSYGWRTAAIDKLARELAKSLNDDPALLAAVAEQLSKGRSNEEFQIAVCLLQRPNARIAENFLLHTRMLERVDNWSKCDALCIRLTGPALLQENRYLKTVVAWARSKNLWKRRAACVTLVLAARRKLFHREIFRTADLLIADPEEMVQKGIGWLLRELGKASPKLAVPYLRKVRLSASRLVLRTACEKLTPLRRKEILGL